MTLPYNLLLLIADAIAIFALYRWRRQWASWIVPLCFAGIAFVLAWKLGRRFESRFGVMRLICCGLFVHGVIVLTADAVFLWFRRHRRFACIVGATASLLVAVGIDAFFVEPTWLDVTHRTIASPKIRKPIRIVVLADLQADRIGPYEREALRRAAAEKPDIMLFAGDYLQGYWKLQDKLAGELNRCLHETFGGCHCAMFAVQGNSDFGDWPKIFKGLDVKTVNWRQSFDVEGMQLICLGLYESFSQQINPTVRDPSRFCIVLGHAPNFALGSVDADLLLAGHTHGGQVQLPLVGALMTNCRVPRSWASGWTDLPGGGHLLVSRGVGMERGYAPRIRFLCRPELTVLDLTPAPR